MSGVWPRSKERKGVESSSEQNKNAEVGAEDLQTRLLNNLKEFLQLNHQLPVGLFKIVTEVLLHYVNRVTGDL